MIKMLTILVMMGLFIDMCSSKLLLVSVKDKASAVTKGKYSRDYSDYYGSDYDGAPVLASAPQAACNEDNCEVELHVNSYEPPEWAGASASAKANAGGEPEPPPPPKHCCTKDNTKFKITQDDNEVNLNPEEKGNNETTTTTTAVPETTTTTTAASETTTTTTAASGSEHGNGKGGKRKVRWLPYPPPPGFYGRGKPPPHPKYMV